MKPLCLIRYDTECDEISEMTGFLPKVVEVHRQHGIPATFFCKGATLDLRRGEFAEFWAEVKDDPLFDLQDHSYTHIGVGYEAGNPIAVLLDDYKRSFDAHEAVFGKRPVGISLCGTGGKDGPRLRGFDQTDKAKAELGMLASLGVKMVNCFLADRIEDQEFCHYASLGHPDIMGFPSGFSDTGWMIEKTEDWGWKRKASFTDAVEMVVGEIRRRGNEGIHMPVMHHDWCAWKMPPNQSLEHVVHFAEIARDSGFELVTHVACYEQTELWRNA